MKILKTVLTIVTATLVMSSNAFAQKGGSSGNCVAQGTIIIDAFYGYPYFNGVLLKSLGSTTDKVRNTNHLGGKVEYMVSDKIGLGMEFTYANATVRYQSDSTHLWYNAGIRKYRILGKMTYHFATNENLDPYFTFGAGLKNTDVYVQGPDGGSVNINLIPVAFRFGIGMRYFFTDFVGVNAEVGIGGPMMQGGLSFKF